MIKKRLQQAKRNVKYIFSFLLLLFLCNYSYGIEKQTWALVTPFNNLICIVGANQNVSLVLENMSYIFLTPVNVSSVRPDNAGKNNFSVVIPWNGSGANSIINQYSHFDYVPVGYRWDVSSPADSYSVSVFAMWERWVGWPNSNRP